MKEKEVGIVITNYNGEQILPLALESITHLDYPIGEVVVVDDGSTDRSIEAAERYRSRLPRLKIVRMGRNTGLINQVRNAGLRAIHTDWVLVTDNDIVFEPDSLRLLVEAQETLSRAVICTPRLMYSDETDRIYSDGQRLHYLCTTIAPSRNEKGVRPGPILEDTAGGGILLLDRSRLNGNGFFNEKCLAGWGDDGSLYRQLTVEGLKCYHVPQSVAYHAAKQRTVERAFSQVQNRWFIMLETYAWRTFIVLAPALLLYEVFLFVLLCIKKVPGAYFRGCTAVIKHMPFILARRKKVQEARKVSDRYTLTSGYMYISPSLLTNKILQIGWVFTNKIFNGYWNMAKRLI
jgi:GT2 family glycosyltransferase